MAGGRARHHEGADRRLVLVRRAWFFFLTLPIAIVGTAAAAVSFLTGAYPQPAGAALFGGLSLLFFAALVHYGRIERAVFDPDDGVTLVRRSLLGTKTVGFPLQQVSGAVVERRRVRSTRESAGWTSPRWVDASRPVLVLADGRRLPIFHLHRGGTWADTVRDRVNAWLAAERGTAAA